MTHRVTHREMEVAQLISFGLTEKEISEVLEFSHHTLKAHKRNLFNKTGCRNIADVTRWYIQHTSGIHMDPPEAIKKLVSAFLLILIAVAEFSDSEFIRQRSRTRRIARTEIVRLRRTRRLRDTYYMTA